MPMTHICITFHDFDSAHRNCERIAGCVALAVDDVRARGRRVYVSTMQPGRFVDAYLAEGYEEPISIQP